jgi:Helix-loop-helix DNA-binding domain
MRSPFVNSSSTSLHKRDLNATPPAIHSNRVNQSQETSDPCLENRMSILASNAQHIWQYPVWPSHPDYVSHDMHDVPMNPSPHVEAFHPEISSNLPDTVGGLNFPPPPGEEFLTYESEEPHSPREPMQKERHRRVHSEWASPLSIPPTNRGYPAPVFESTMSPFSPAITPSTPIGSAWISVAGSAYGSHPNSSPGSGSSPADSIMQGMHYISTAKAETSPIGNSEPASAVSANAHILQSNSTSTAELTFNAKAAPADPKDRLRQDAHSKVEKRYRMNINSKIQQLKDILPSVPPPSGKRPANPGFSSRRRRSGAELSKRDILSLTITNMERLQYQVEQLTSLNKELTDKIAAVGSQSIRV